MVLSPPPFYPNFTNFQSPGQSLPDFPTVTHGSPPLLPHVTLHEAISNINPIDPLHRDVRRFATPRFSNVNLFAPFPATIMASNSTTKIHPDGTRNFSNRELARCQTFPDDHKFGNTHVQRRSLSSPPFFLLLLEFC